MRIIRLIKRGFFERKKKIDTKGKFNIHGYARKTGKKKEKEKKTFNFFLNLWKCLDESGNRGEFSFEKVDKTDNYKMCTSEFLASSFSPDYLCRDHRKYLCSFFLFSPFADPFLLQVILGLTTIKEGSFFSLLSERKRAISFFLFVLMFN